MDELLKRKTRIEHKLAKKHLTDGCVILYDITNIWFEGEYKNSQKVVYGKGNSKYVLYTFTDPDCPFCQKLEKEFSRSNIEVNYLFTPIERLHPLAATKAKQLISNTQDIPRLLNKIREGDTLNVKENSESKIILEKMKKIAKMFNFESTPLSIVIDKRTDTVVDFIQGADMKKIKQYIKGEKDEK